MKSLFAITLIATMAVTSAMAAKKANQADLNAVADIGDEAIAAMAATVPGSTENDGAMWKKKKHNKNGNNGKRKRKTCCIKYVTVTSVPACKPTPTVCPHPVEAAFDPLQIKAAMAPPAPQPL